jgi:hypothetical protein
MDMELPASLAERLENPSSLLLTLLIGVPVFALLLRGHMRGSYGPDTWSLDKERPRVLRGLVHVLVWPLRLLAALFSSAVALLVFALLAGFAYVLWRIWNQ